MRGELLTSWAISNGWTHDDVAGRGYVIDDNAFTAKGFGRRRRDQHMTGQGEQEDRDEEPHLYSVRSDECRVSTRAAEVSITGGALSSVWPEVAPRLRRLLLQRGVSKSDAEDLVQEVAFKVIHHEVAYTDGEDLYRWCSVVARRMSIGLARKRRVEVLPDSFDSPGVEDVERSVQARVDLATVARMLDALPLLEREVLMSSGVGEPSHLAVRRFRTRRKLRLAIDRGEVLVALVVSHRAWRSMRSAGPAIGGAVAVAAVAVISLGNPQSEPSAMDPEPAKVDLRRAGVVTSGPTHVPSTAESTRLATSGVTPTTTPPRQRAASVVPDLPDSEFRPASPAGQSTGIGTRDRMPDDRIVCIVDDPTFGTLCTPL